MIRTNIDYADDIISAKGHIIRQEKAGSFSVNLFDFSIIQPEKSNINNIE